MNLSSEQVAFNRLAELTLHQHFWVPGRVIMILSHTITQLSPESGEYFWLLYTSRYTQGEQDVILSHNPICFRNLTIPGWNTKNLIIYTVDESNGRVYRWSKPAPDELEFWGICDIGDFEPRIESLMKKWFTFIPPVSRIE